MRASVVVRMVVVVSSAAGDEGGGAPLPNMHKQGTGPRTARSRPRVLSVCAVPCLQHISPSSSYPTAEVISLRDASYVLRAQM